MFSTFLLIHTSIVKIGVLEIRQISFKTELIDHSPIISKLRLVGIVHTFDHLAADRGPSATVFAVLRCIVLYCRSYSLNRIAIVVC